MDFFSADNKDFHAEYEQLRQQKKALNVNFDSIDFDTRTGKAGHWKVSLERCTCADFWKTGKPCKHMYRLASELGVFELDPEKIQTALEASPHHNLYGCELSISAPSPKNFVVVDFERANRFNDSICQVGIVVVKNNRVDERKSFLVRPPYRKFTATKIHGITFDDVKRKPTFNALWSQLIKYFDRQTIAAFALPHDLNYLFATLDGCKIPRPKFTAFDVQANVHACLKKDSALEGLKGISLVAVAEKLGFTHDAHDALSDALVTAQIQIHLSKNFPQENTFIYYSTSAAVAEGFIKDKIPLENVVNYCKRLLASTELSDRTAYEKFLRQVKRAASNGFSTQKETALIRALRNVTAST